MNLQGKQLAVRPLETVDAPWFDSPSAYRYFASLIKASIADPTVAVPVVFVGDSTMFGYQTDGQASVITAAARELRRMFPTANLKFIDRSIPGWGFVQFLGSTSASYPSNSAIGSAAPAGRPGRDAWNVNDHEEHNFRWPEGAASFTATTWKDVVKADKPALLIVGLGFNDMVGGLLPIKSLRDDLAGLISVVGALTTSTQSGPSVCLMTEHTGNPAAGQTTITDQDKLRGMNGQIRQAARAYDFGLWDVGRAFDRRVRGLDPLRFKMDTERYLTGYGTAALWQADYYNNSPSSSPVSGAGTSGVAIDSTGLHSALAIASFARKLPCQAMGVHFNLRKLATDNDQVQVTTGGGRGGSGTLTTERQTIVFRNQSGAGKIDWVMDNTVLQTVTVAAFPTNGTSNYWIEVLYDGSQIYVWLNGNSGPNAPDATFQFAAHAPAYPCIGYSNLVGAPAVKITGIVFQFGKEEPFVAPDTTLLELFGVGPLDDYLTSNASLGGDAALHPSTLGNHLVYEPPMMAVLHAIRLAVSTDLPIIGAAKTSSFTIDATHNKSLFAANSASLITVTVPGPATKKIGPGFECEIIRGGNGFVHFTPSGADCLLLFEPGADTITAVNRTAKLICLTASSTQAVWLITQSNTPQIAATAGQALYLDCHYDGTSIIADQVSASVVQNNAVTGAWELYQNTGLTIGSAFTPTLRMSVSPTAASIVPPLTLANGSVATTQSQSDNSTKVATTAYADAAKNAAKSYADGLVVGLWDDRGTYDASGNTFPASGGSGTSGAILKGDIWTVSVAGTLGGSAVAIGDTVRALVDTPGQTAGNWSVLQTNLALVVASGSYTPTLFNTTNVTASSVVSPWQWLRIGNVVTVSGVVTIDPNTLAATVLGISLPVASAFVNVGDAAGTAAAPNQAAGNAASAAIYADTPNARLALQWTAVGTANQTWLAHATYTIK